MKKCYISPDFEFLDLFFPEDVLTASTHGEGDLSGNEDDAPEDPFEGLGLNNSPLVENSF